MPDTNRSLKVFLCHAHSDKNTVRTLYNRLVKDGVDAWLDKEKLLPGQNWRTEIQKAVRSADVVVVCHSKEFNQAGFRQREVKWALDTAMEMPEGEIFVIPARLEECEVLDSLSEWHWVDLFSSDGYDMLMKALYARADKVGATLRARQSWFTKISASRIMSEKKDSSDLTPLQELAEPKEVVREIPDGFGISTSKVITQPKAGSFQPQKKIVVAIIALITTVIAAILGFPRMVNWFGQIFTPIPLASEMVDDNGVRMVLIPSGVFMMGSSSGHVEEQPVHVVLLDNYYIDKYEVTNAQYKVCVDAGRCEQPTNINLYVNIHYEQHPVVFINWDMASTYCEWRDARLPTEAEWEKAARGTTERTYPWGEGIDCTFANFKTDASFCVGDTTPVGTYEKGRSLYGVYDMAGNVMEWVADWYDESYYSKSSDANPLGPEKGKYRVLRGGAWNSNEFYLRTTNRSRVIPVVSQNTYGMRCARSP